MRAIFRNRSRSALVLLGIAWAMGVLGGLAVVFAYSATPGKPASPPPAWPAGSSVARSTETPTLVLFVHPRCPCTRATVEDLAVLLDRLKERVSARVIFVLPEGLEPGWEKTDLWTSAARIPRVSVATDRGGVEAARFGASTSGQALLYGRDGRLLYSGGLTAARGHAGDNAGADRIEAIVRGEAGVPKEGAVYGCGLHSPSCCDSGSEERHP